ncbi:MAG: encapsulin, partial [Stellaceae bacterium]
MNHLHREVAPISASGWEEIDKEATRTLKTSLGARRIVDFVGPKGWDYAAVATGRTEGVAPPVKGALEA